MGETFQPTPDQVTIVMATRGRRDLVAQRVRDILHRPFLLVVDRGRTHLDLPDNLPVDVDVIECAPDGGACRAHEAGFMAAKTPFVMTCSDDAIPALDFV